MSSKENLRAPKSPEISSWVCLDTAQYIMRNVESDARIVQNAQKIAKNARYISLSKHLSACLVSRYRG